MRSVTATDGVAYVWAPIDEIVPFGRSERDEWGQH